MNTNKSSSVFTALESSLSEFDNIFGTKVSIFEALESAIETGMGNLGLGEKFTFAAFESFIDEAIANLEVAEEGTVLARLLQTAKNTINNKCTTVENCDVMLSVIATEAVKFNSCMESMANAGKELKAGSISKEEFKEKIAPAINELKANCETLGIANESSVSISDEHISTMREFIIGTSNLISEKKLSFGGTLDASLEGFISSCESMTIAEEGVNLQTAKLIRSDDVKEARKLIKGARKLAKSRSKESLEKAISMLHEAKTLVGKAKKEIDSMPEAITKWEKVKAFMTPIFSLLPREEIKEVIPNYDYNTRSMTVTVISEKIEDELSKSTASKLKKTLQEMLNLLLKNIDKDISSYEKESNRVSSSASESVDSIDGFLFELALESYNDDDEDDECCEDDDESSYDSYLK